MVFFSFFRFLPPLSLPSVFEIKAVHCFSTFPSPRFPLSFPPPPQYSLLSLLPNGKGMSLDAFLWRLPNFFPRPPCSVSPNARHDLLYSPRPFPPPPFFPPKRKDFFFIYFRSHSPGHSEILFSPLTHTFSSFESFFKA